MSHRFETPLSLKDAHVHLDDESLIVLLSSQGLWSHEETWQPLSFSNWKSMGLPERAGDPHFLGSLDGIACFCFYLEDVKVLEGQGCWVDLRSLLSNSNEAFFELANRASQVCTWERTHRFCGQCGAKNQYHVTDRALVCDDCGLHNYPRISPCIIVLVRKGKQCLLARNARTASQYFSCLAGFVEAGESVEQCLHREVMEEVGVEVENLQYVGSQAWPFPGQLMIGFIADYKAGDITPEPEEIAEADWFDYDQLPLVPPSRTISGLIIDAFVSDCKSPSTHSTGG